MGEIGDIWREIKKERQEARWMRLEHACDKGWIKHNTFHWYRMVGNEKLEYWPSTGRCRYKGKSRNINSKLIKSLISKYPPEDAE